MHPLEGIVDYDEASPSGLTWIVDVQAGARTIQAGTPAGGRTIGQRYWSVGYGNVDYLAHRVIWELVFGSIPHGYYVDHIDGNSLNNAVANLRVVLPVHNSRNAKMYTNNTSGHAGVSLRLSGNCLCWTAKVHLHSGVKTKSFSVQKYGDEALSLAVAWREDKLKNFAEEGYTSRHGKKE